MVKQVDLRNALFFYWYTCMVIRDSTGFLVLSGISGKAGKIISHTRRSEIDLEFFILMVKTGIYSGFLFGIAIDFVKCAASSD